MAHTKTDIPTGLGGQLMVAKEGAYGTGATPTLAYPHNEVGLEVVKENIEPAGMKTGEMLKRTTARHPFVKGAAGQIVFEVQRSGMVKLFESWFGNAVTTTPGGATNARLHTCTFDKTSVPSAVPLTIQVGVPDIAAANNVEPITYQSCIVTGGELSWAVGETVKLALDFDAQVATHAVDLAAAVYSTDEILFDWNQIGLTVGGAAVTCKSGSFKLTHALDTDRYYSDGTGLKWAPILLDRPTVEFSAECEFESMAKYDDFIADTARAIVLTITGAIIEAAIPYKIVISAPDMRLVGDPPKLSGSGKVMQTLNYEAVHHATPITCLITNVDTAA